MACVEDVPIYDNVVERCEKEQLIETTLRELALANGPPLRILVLHGIAGSGKTYLASKVVTSLLEEFFKHGIIWRSMEHLKKNCESEIATETAAIKIKLLDTKDSQQERKLLVLDGVWRSSILKAFEDTPIVILVTTRNMAIANDLREKSAIIRKVDAMKCNNSEAERIIESRFDRVQSKLIRRIQKKCDGIAQALAIVATEMSDIATLAGWQKRTNEIMNIEEWLQDETKCDDVVKSSYTSFFDSLNASIENMDKGEQFSATEMQDLYFHLAFTETGEELSGDKVRTFWDVQRKSAEQLLDWFADRSLLEKTTIFLQSNQKQKQTIFKIHRLQLASLKKEVKKKKNIENVSAQRMCKWLVTKLEPEDKTSCMYNEAQNHQIHKMTHVIRTIEFGGRWDQCFDSLAALIECWDDLPYFLLCLLKKYVVQGDLNYGWTPLHEAARLSRRDLIRKLLDASIENLNINAKTTCRFWFKKFNFFPGNTPLLVAGAKGDFEMIKDFVSRGADVNATTEIGWTPLHWARHHGTPSVIAYLTCHGAKSKEEDDAAIKKMHIETRKADLFRHPVHSHLVELNKSNKQVYCIVCQSTFRPMPVLTFAFNPVNVNGSWGESENKKTNGESLMMSQGCVMVTVTRPDSETTYLIDTLKGKAYGTDNVHKMCWEENNGPVLQRIGATAVAQGTKVYVIGGSEKDSSDCPTGKVECFDTGSKEWNSLADPLPIPVYLPASVVHPSTNHIVVIGGQNIDGKWMKWIQYRSEAGNWRTQQIAQLEDSAAISAIARTEDVILSVNNRFVSLFWDIDEYKIRDLASWSESITTWSDSIAIWQDNAILTCWERVWMFNLSNDQLIEMPPLPMKEKMQTFAIVAKPVDPILRTSCEIDRAVLLPVTPSPNCETTLAGERSCSRLEQTDISEQREDGPEERPKHEDAAASCSES